MCFGYSNPYSHVHYRQIVCIKESKKLSENEKEFGGGPACSTSLKSKETRGNAFTNVESKGPSHLGTNHELYDRAGCRKQQSEICIHIGTMASSGQLSTHCAPTKSCFRCMQLVLSTRQLVQDHGT